MGCRGTVDTGTVDTEEQKVKRNSKYRGTEDQRNSRPGETEEHGHRGTIGTEEK